MPDLGLLGYGVDRGWPDHSAKQLCFLMTQGGTMATIRGTNRADWISTEDTSPGVRGGPVTQARDLIRAGSGDDTVFAGGGSDTVLGEGGRDRLHGGAGNDLLEGGIGDDRLWGNEGNDRLLGGPGTDEAVYAGARDDYDIRVASGGRVTVRDRGGAVDGVDEGTDTLLGVERLRFLGGDGLQLGAVHLVSASAEGVIGGGFSSSGGLSADGKVASFWSEADNLVPGDTNGASDVFVRNLATGAVTRVSVSAGGEQGNGASNGGDLSADGNHVLFGTFATNLLPEEGASRGAILTKDLTTGALVRVDTNAAGEAANSGTNATWASSDNNLVGLTSLASNLVPDDNNGAWDAFLKRLDTGEVVRLSTSSEGVEGNDWSMYPSVSANARLAVFQSDASNLVPGDTNGSTDIFLKNLDTQAVMLVSTSAAGAQGDSYSAGPSISADGTLVAFWSAAVNLVPGDTNGVSDLFVKNVVTGGITRVSTSASGEQGDNFSEWGTLSADGSRIAFWSAATNLVPGDITAWSWDVFVKDLSSGDIVRATAAADGTGSNDFRGPPGITADGSRVLFDTFAANLVAGDTNGTEDVFVRDLTVRSGDETVFEIGRDGTLRPIEADSSSLWT
jgi:Tol biopolymer transport system component